MKILSFDIEEWFHILDNASTKTEVDWMGFESRIRPNVDRILKLLDDHGQQATFFCLGWIGSKYPEVIRQIHACGHEIGSHSHMHQLVYEQKQSEFREDLVRSLDTLQQLIGEKITVYRAPGFSITEECFWVFEILLSLGITCDCSIFPAQRSHGGVAQFPYKEPFKIEVNGRFLKEMPMSIFQMGSLKVPFSGGGYFRLFPYSAIKFMNARSPYLMTYFHPRDFDANQPVIQDLTLFKRFKSYTGLNTAYEKLDRFLQDNDFRSVRDAIGLVNWDQVPVHKLNN